MHKDFFELLEEDHDKVKDILEKLEDTSQGAVKTREDLFLKLKKEIIPHMKAEEKRFYPALKDNKQSRESVMEAVEEHHVTELVLNELDAMPKDDEYWGAKLKVFKELVEHHIEEEEDEIFEAAESVLEKEQMEQIMVAFQKEKKSILSEIK